MCKYMKKNIQNKNVLRIMTAPIIILKRIILFFAKQVT